MDERTIAIIVMGSIVLALGAFATYMEGRQRARDEARKRGQVRRLRMRRHTHRQHVDHRSAC